MSRHISKKKKGPSQTPASKPNPKAALANAIRNTRAKLWAAIMGQTNEPRKPRLVRDRSGAIYAEVPNGRRHEGTQIRRVAMVDGKPQFMPRVRMSKKHRLAQRRALVAA